MRDCADIDPRLAGVRASPQRRTILRTLLRSWPETAPHEALRNAAFGDFYTIKVQVCYLRQELDSTKSPLRIETDHCYGYRAVWAK